jgi:hypothetical protein
MSASPSQAACAVRGSFVESRQSFHYTPAPPSSLVPVPGARCPPESGGGVLWSLRRCRPCYCRRTWPWTHASSDFFSLSLNTAPLDAGQPRALPASARCRNQLRRQRTVTLAARVWLGSAAPGSPAQLIHHGRPAAGQRMTSSIVRWPPVATRCGVAASLPPPAPGSPDASSSPGQLPTKLQRALCHCARPRHGHQLPQISPITRS